jgi:IMP dehydrogenase
MIGNLKEIMTKNLVTVSPDSSVRRAVELMEEFRIGCLPVLDDNHLVGVITSRDIKRAHPNRLVADAMSKNVITTTPDCSLWDTKKLLDFHQIERVIVIEDNFPVGIVTKAQLYAELGKHIDTLTNLAQSTFLRSKALELLRNNQEICVIFFDMDNFGIINKELGHVMGDLILCQAAKILREHLDEATDYLCRYAGDEFAIVSTKSLPEAQELVVRIITGIKAIHSPKGIEIGASVGIAVARQSTCHNGDLIKVVDDLINNASLASTKAKREKNCLVVA